MIRLKWEISRSEDVAERDKYNQPENHELVEYSESKLNWFYDNLPTRVNETRRSLTILHRDYPIKSQYESSHTEIKKFSIIVARQLYVPCDWADVYTNIIFSIKYFNIAYLLNSSIFHFLVYLLFLYLLHSFDQLWLSPGPTVKSSVYPCCIIRCFTHDALLESSESFVSKSLISAQNPLSHGTLIEHTSKQISWYEKITSLFFSTFFFLEQNLALFYLFSSTDTKKQCNIARAFS